MCVDSEDGAFGLIINQATDSFLSDFFDDVFIDVPVFVGGPVESNTLHFVHRKGLLVEDTIQISENLWWSGDFGSIKTLLNTGVLGPDDIRFFLGYSGWGEGQLRQEINDSVWVITESSPEIIFETPTQNTWRDSLLQLGGNYTIMANSPASPRLN